MSWIAVNVVLGAVWCGLLGVNWLLRRISRYARAGELLRRGFFRDVQALIDPQPLPRGVEQRLDELAAAIDDPRISWRLLRAGLRGDLRREIDEPSRATRALLAELDGLADERRELVAGVTAEFLIAATFNSLFLGTLPRRLMLFWIRPAEQSAVRVFAALDPVLLGRRAHA